ncbi:MAG: hypothetical protein IJI03_02570, partial [Rudaea sp.]|nr:hypothetical protein [Rudaea sp.]
AVRHSGSASTPRWRAPRDSDGAGKSRRAQSGARRLGRNRVVLRRLAPDSGCRKTLAATSKSGAD